MISLQMRTYNSLRLTLFISYGDSVARITKNLIEKHGHDKVIVPASAFGKDVLPRLGGLLDVQPISDVI